MGETQCGSEDEASDKMPVPLKEMPDEGDVIDFAPDDPAHDERCNCGARPDYEYQRRVENR